MPTGNGAEPSLGISDGDSTTASGLASTRITHGWELQEVSQAEGARVMAASGTGQQEWFDGCPPVTIIWQRGSQGVPSRHCHDAPEAAEANRRAAARRPLTTRGAIEYLNSIT